MAVDFDWGADEGLQGQLLALEDELVGAGDGLEGAAVRDAEDEGVIEAAGALEDGATTAAAPEDADLAVAADGEVGFERGLVGVAEDHEGFGWLPEAEDFVLGAFFAQVEEGLVAGQVFGRGGEGEVDIFHCATAVLIYSLGPSQVRTLSNAAVWPYIGHGVGR